MGRGRPGDETPYREWGAAALSRRDRPGAPSAYRRGRERLHRPDALAAEMAQLAAAEGNYAGAAAGVAAGDPPPPGLSGHRGGDAVPGAGVRSGPRCCVARQREPDFTARRLEAELRARWGDPLGALRGARGRRCPPDRVPAIEALARIARSAPAAAGTRRPAGHRAGRSRRSRREARSRRRSRLRLEAAQAYLPPASGLQRGGCWPASPTTGGARAHRVQRRDDARSGADRRGQARRGGAAAGRAPRRSCRGRVRRAADAGWRWAGSGRATWRAPTRASPATARSMGSRWRAASTSTGAIWPARSSASRRRGRTPATAPRPPSARRCSLCCSRSRPTRSRRLGQALLLLERGDTSQAAAALEQVAAELPPAQGGAELRLLAGRLAAAAGKPADAERLFRAAAVEDAPAHRAGGRAGAGGAAARPAAPRRTRSPSWST